ncbi:c-type cytochrome biogenesis protein CcsB [Pseudonocardia abyssalis]|jgi:cytochrome c-type biogenesis protein CcsB|uniref:C-type cytochrome biogenesis protein CcsB n=1 Tax=Pseudonocardia abyssalis TaxID=2792008 RepID=A0ABS6V047_9PSEU|nr:c-type cytochrome biogenesis protein CcsB [Pseudonocardia abyssalis]MBW0118163.1 c-type cytochrome biogenesis protein CcsB [Pseudonocardia abyssalis]MBW0137886.1 c-type cytochrome biogenesis protein CcsB [Pseudonocardia abyssalis]
MLAQYSDLLFMAAVGVYVLAMVLHAVEFAAARSAKPVLVGAGGPDVVEVAPAPARSERCARMAVSLTVLGAALQFASIVTRGLAAERWPLGNMYEFVSAICLAAIVGWLVMLRRSPVTRAVGPFVVLLVVVLLFLAGTVLYAQAAPVVPALQSYWLVIHVTTITISSGLLLVPGVASILFLVRGAGWLTDRLPSSDVLDRLAYRVTIIAFPLFTFAVIAGAIWAEAAWGRFWGWDPKETVAFVSWVVYAAYLHARATAGWRAARAAWINVAGFATVLFNLFFINMVVAGLHSYAGLG